MSNYVILKGKSDRLVIYLNNEVEFSVLKDILVSKIKEAKNFIGNGHLAIEFSNRILTENEEDILLEVIKNNSDLKISYVFSNGVEGEEKKIKFIKSPTQEGFTKFHRGTLRSGAKLEYDGNIVILGDVNPGAIVKANGNVIVLGFLNGTVYAGQNGNLDAFIGAIYMNPVQMIIGNCVAQPLQKEILETNKVKRKDNFEIAFLRDKEIVIETFTGKL